MKAVAKPIEMIARFNKEGVPQPVRFRISLQDESNIIINIDKVIYRDVEKLAGNKRMVFKCKSIIGGEERVYELKYEIDTCRWILFKI